MGRKTGYDPLMAAHSEQIGAGVLVIVIGATLWLSRTPAVTVDGKVVIKPKSVAGFVRQDQAIDGTLAVTHILTGDTFVADAFLNNFYWTPKERDSGVWKVKYTRYRYLVDPGFDIGTYAGYRDGLDVGIRFSPVRFLYGTVALDALVGEDAAGVGASLYPMPEYFGPLWHHVGIGYGYAVDYKTADAGNLYYLSLSTRF